MNNEKLNKAAIKHCGYHAHMVGDTYDFKKDYLEGYMDCKEEVLRILNKNWTGADLSVNSCDEYYIEKIKKL